MTTIKGHLPRTAAQGIFVGEARPLPASSLNTAADQGNILILNSGLPARLPYTPGVDHDRGLVSLWSSRILPADLSGLPPAVRVEHTAARRRQREPVFYVGNDPETGKPLYQTYWQFRGEETGVTSRQVGANTYRFFDEHLHFDGGTSQSEPLERPQALTAYEFDWRLETRVDGVLTTFLASEIDGGKYRVLNLTEYGMEWGRRESRYLQIHVSNYKMPGERTTGLYVPSSRVADMNLYDEITAVLGYEYRTDGAGAQYITHTVVNAWVNFAVLEPSWDYDYRVPRETDEGFIPPGEPNWGWIPGGEGTVAWGRSGWYSRTVGAGVAILRDVIAAAVPATPPPPDRRFTAHAAAVTVTGPRTLTTARLGQATDGTPDTLSAFGHEFTGGTWAALRDRPRWDEENKEWDYSPLIVLHASDTTVTAVRPDGGTETCSIAQFETDVLRTAPGSFLGFNSVGSLSHSWPPEWAWANCDSDTRAMCAHEPWRDSYKRGAPRDSPADWTWTGRPRKKPRKPPETAPRGLLGLALADVTGIVTQDEAIPKGKGPVEPPLTALTAEGVDVLKRLAKRLPYSPAEIPDERDDRTGVTGTVTVTFPPPPRPPDEPLGGFAALYLVGKYPPDATLTVNGEQKPLQRLGHNAGQRRGNHPYVALVPLMDSYTLKLPGKTTLIGRCARYAVLNSS